MVQKMKQRQSQTALPLFLKLEVYELIKGNFFILISYEKSIYPFITDLFCFQRLGVELEWMSKIVALFERFIHQPLMPPFRITELIF